MSYDSVLTRLSSSRMLEAHSYRGVIKGREMSELTLERREFIKSILAGLPLAAWDWSLFPRGNQDKKTEGTYDVIVIGAGLGGLSAAAAFARQGFKTLVLEQHSVPGGYASAFTRPGGFTFDVSLHSTTVGIRNGVANLIAGFPEIQDIIFVPHKTLYRAVYPDHDIRVPHRDVPGYIKVLQDNFPEEKQGIADLVADMTGLTEEVNRITAAEGKVDMSRFPLDFPHLFKNFNRTWGAMVDDRIKGPKLKAVVSGLWGYFGLPPSKLSTYYYAMPVIGYLEGGGYYPIGTSQKISDAFADLIRSKGGEIKLMTRVEKILTRNHTAYGVRTADGTEYLARAVVSNANAVDTFTKMLDEKDFLRSYLDRMSKFSVSYSTFQVWLGLKKDLVREVGLGDSEIFFHPGYDIEAEYEAILAGDMSERGFGLTIYDNLYPGCSPRGKNTINIISSQGYEPWKRFEADYFKGNKDAYYREKKRIADLLIDRAEEKFLPGLRDSIEVMEAATPLTNVRFTGNYRGAIYGWDQTVDNSGNRRVQHDTPIKNLFLSGAWTAPGGGYGACIPSGLMCFAKVMESWSGNIV
jgi:all-trans-retinol 13,14-reductase